jgi:electron transport complex protein RnfG
LKKLRDLIKMVVVLTAICSGSALVLSYANQATRNAREYQLLKYVKEPSIKAVLSGYDNDPVVDRFSVKLGSDEKGKPLEKNVFPAKEGGNIIAFAYDSSASGYNGPIGVMVGLDMEGKITGIAIMTHAETPGLGARVVEPEFTKQFKGMTLTDDLNVSAAGGKIDGVSGATYSTKGVVDAVRKALELLPTVDKEVKGS